MWRADCGDELLFLLAGEEENSSSFARWSPAACSKERGGKERGWKNVRTCHPCPRLHSRARKGKKREESRNSTPHCSLITAGWKGKEGLEETCVTRTDPGSHLVWEKKEKGGKEERSLDLLRGKRLPLLQYCYGQEGEKRTARLPR